MSKTDFANLKRWYIVTTVGADRRQIRETIMAAAMPGVQEALSQRRLDREASSWAEVQNLFKTERIVFAGKPGMAEGPDGLLHQWSIY